MKRFWVAGGVIGVRRLYRLTEAHGARGPDRLNQSWPATCERPGTNPSPPRLTPQLHSRTVATSARARPPYGADTSTASLFTRRLSTSAASSKACGSSETRGSETDQWM